MVDLKTIAIAGIVIYFFGDKIVGFVKGLAGGLSGGAAGNVGDVYDDVGVYASSIRKPSFYNSLNSTEKNFYNMWVQRFGFGFSSVSELKSELKKVTSLDKNLTNNINKSIKQTTNNIIKNTRKNAKLLPHTNIIPGGVIPIGSSPFDSFDSFPDSSSLPEFTDSSNFGDPSFDDFTDNEGGDSQFNSDARNVAIDKHLSDIFGTGSHAQNRITFL